MTDAAAAEPFASRDEADGALSLLEQANAAYYDGAVPDDPRAVMDDATYDTLAERVAAHRDVHPEWDTRGVLDRVAGGADVSGDVPHSAPMLSLAKNKEGVGAWWAGAAAATGGLTGGVVVEPKIDGVALAVRYEAGRVTRVLTRGDGTHGEDVTRSVLRDGVHGLPDKIPQPLDIEVRGEAFLTDAGFGVAVENRVAAGGAPFANPRNAAAGTIRNGDRAYHVPLSFAAYSVHGDDVEGYPHDEAMDVLRYNGILPVADLAPAGASVVYTAADAQAAVEAVGRARETLGFPVDGAVVKANEQADREAAGNATRHPKWATACKFPPVERQTKLLGVTVQIGRTGVLTPVAELDPVHVDGSVVSRATLHNMAQVEKLGVRVGDTVTVKKAGDIIPRVEGVVEGLRPPGSEPWEPPACCPGCGSDDIDKSEERWRCTDPSCSLGAAVAYLGKRDVLDIEGLGTSMADRLVNEDLVASLPDVFRLTPDDVASLDGYGKKSAEKLCANIEAAKAQPLNRVICALGIRKTGRTMSSRLAEHFGSLDALCAASGEELAEVEGIGPKKAAMIRDELDRKAGVVDELKALGLTSETSPPEPLAGFGGGPLPLDGKKCVVSGKVPGYSRQEAGELVVRLGGKSSGSVSKNTDILFAGDGAGSKLGKAESFGVEVRTADDLLGLVEEAEAGTRPADGRAPATLDLF